MPRGAPYDANESLQAACFLVLVLATLYLTLHRFSINKTLRMSCQPGY